MSQSRTRRPRYYRRLESRVATQAAKMAPRRSVGAQGRRFTGEERGRAIELIVSGLDRSAIAKATGCTAESLRRWFNQAKATGALPQPKVRAAASSTCGFRRQDVADHDS